MIATLNTEMGDVTIGPKAIAYYAGSIAVGCVGIVGMASVSIKDGIIQLLSGDKISKGIKVEIDENNEINLSFHVIVSYGVNVSSVCQNLTDTVSYKIKDLCGLNVKSIMVYVEDVRKID